MQATFAPLADLAAPAGDAALERELQVLAADGHVGCNAAAALP